MTGGGPLQSRRAASIHRSLLGRSQAVRQRILIPPFPGSIPGAPAIRAALKPIRLRAWQESRIFMPRQISSLIHLPARRDEAAA